MKELNIPQWAMELRVYMARMGLNVKKTVELTGLSNCTISNFMHGSKRPSVKSCDKIKKGIGFDMLEALYLSDKKEREEEENEGQQNQDKQPRE